MSIKFFSARYDAFLERDFISKKSSRSKVDLEEIQDSTNELEHEQLDVEQTPQMPVVPQLEIALEMQEPRSSTRVHREPKRLNLSLIYQDEVLLVENDEQLTYNEVVASPDFEKWIEAMKSEMDSMYTNQVWDLVDAPVKVMPIGYKWVFKTMTDMDRNVNTCNVRLVFNGFT